MRFQETIMSFVPPRCPHRDCPSHVEPQPGFCRRRGCYWPRCRSDPVPRFRCLSCRRSFSRQTFRHDFRDRRPECNAPLFLLASSGVGLRQIGRLLHLDISSVQHKHRKIASTCRDLHDNLSPKLPEERTFLLDEEETYEGASIRPVTMPVLIEKETWFVVATAVGSIRRLAPEGTRRRRRQEREEAISGPRPDESSQCVQAVLEELRRKVPTGRLRLGSDQKTSYATLARQVFGDRVEHATTSGLRIRHTHNPLFAINTTLAMTRDNCGRLRRKSWLVSKCKRFLAAQMNLFAVYRNYVRRRFNRDAVHETPARHLELVPRQLRGGEVLAWRQDWGKRSIHPLSYQADRTVAERIPLFA